MPAFNWSSPVRQRAEEILHPIPHEVYHEIFSYLEPGDDFTYKESRIFFSNLALVCKFFCSIALPRLFSSLDICGTAHGLISSASPNYAHFCIYLVQEYEPAHTLALHAASHVNTMHFSSWDPMRWMPQFSLFGMYFKAVRRMHNIETLKLYRTPIGILVIEAFHALPRLKCLSVINCKFFEDFRDATAVQNVSSLELSSLEFINNYDNKSKDFLASAFTFNSMKTLCTDTVELLRALSRQKEALALEELELHKLHEDHFEYLDAVLQKLPCLTGLHLHNMQVSPSSKLSFSLSPGAIPNTLTYIACPAFMFHHSFKSHQTLELISVSEVQIGRGWSRGKSLKLMGRYEKEMFPHRLSLSGTWKSPFLST